MLRVRYTFRGRMHYAEFPDYVPVVLPLQGMSAHFSLFRRHRLLAIVGV